MPPVATWAMAVVLQFAIAICAGYLTTRAVEFPFLRLRDAVFPDHRASVAATPARGMQHPLP
ncbi:hypothetical protein D3C87_2132730 [compost metagenome]